MAHLRNTELLFKNVFTYQISQSSSYVENGQVPLVIMSFSTQLYSTKVFGEVKYALPRVARDVRVGPVIPLAVADGSPPQLSEGEFRGKDISLMRNNLHIMTRNLNCNSIVVLRDEFSGLSSGEVTFEFYFTSGY